MTGTGPIESNERSSRFRLSARALPECYSLAGTMPGVAHEAARISRCARRRGGGVAARGARAAAGDAGDWGLATIEIRSDFADFRYG
jgi:hypothetical protein